MRLEEPAPAEQLRRDGYAVLPGFLASDEVRHARALVEARLAQPIDASCVRPHNTLAPLRWHDPLVGLVLASGARLQRLRRATGARDLRWISGYASTKDPHSPPLWWHQDWWCWGHPLSFAPEAAQIAVLTYLTQTGPRDGALRVLPGSHHRSNALHALLPEAHAAAVHALPEGHPVLQDQPGQATLSVQRGDAVVLDYRLLHGTHANAAPSRRDCLVLNFTPAWSSLPDDVQGHLIQHPALPTAGEGGNAPWLPTFQGARRDLPLERNAPASFRIG